MDSNNVQEILRLLEEWNPSESPEVQRALKNLNNKPKYDLVPYTRYALYDYQAQDYLRTSSGKVRLMSETDAHILKAELENSEESI